MWKTLSDNIAWNIESGEIDPLKPFKGYVSGDHIYEVTMKFKVIKE